MTALLRNLFWLGLFGLVLLAWGWLYLMSLNSGLDMFGRPGLWAETLAALCTGTEAGAAALAAVWGMWAAMGIAMMLPTLVPFLAAHETLTARMPNPMAGRIGVILGYLAVWAGFSVAAAVAQVSLSRAGLVDEFGAAASSWLQGALLLLAGAWQFTETKTRCQSACLSPMAYLMGRYRPGMSGGARMGLELGLDCLGCCWAIMALGFVGGVMNLAWMGLATIFMVMEKLPSMGDRLRRPAGAVLLASGVAVLALNVI